MPTATILGGIRMHSQTKLNFPLPDPFVPCVVPPGSADYCVSQKKKKRSGVSQCHAKDLR